MDSTSILDLISQSQAQKEVTSNALSNAASGAIIFAMRASTTAGLTWGYYGGRFNGTAIPNGTLALTASNTNYVVVHKTTLAITVSTSNTNWNNTSTYGRCYKIVAGSASVTSYEDHREAIDGTGIFSPNIAAGGGLLAANNLSDVANAGTSRTNLGLVGIASSGSASDLSAGTVAAARMPALTGDVTTSAGAVATAIANNVVTLAKMATVATARFLGRITAGTGNVEALTGTQATSLLDAMVGDSGSGGTKGLVPAPGAGDAAAGKFLKADGTYAVPSGTGGGDFVMIAQVVASGSPATIAFNSIPSGYTDLKIIITGRSTNGSVTDAAVRIQFNGDSTSGNYVTSQFLYNSSSAAASATTVAASANGVDIGRIPGSNAQANAVGSTEITIPLYAGTTFWKPVRGLVTEFSGNAVTIFNMYINSVWKSTAAITDIVLTPDTAFVDGSTATLYGLG